MKMVKSLLLGSAAGLVAVTAGQAADLPVKAKPVEYVKICSLYGAGFYYMPGTDLCIKIGGWVRAEIAYGNINGSLTWGGFNGNAQSRNTSNEAFRARGYITADVRNQTEYGTVRGYIAVGLNTTDIGLQVANLVDSANRAFVQWAGMTAGLSQSFYDFYSPASVHYRGGYLPASDTGDGGWWVWAYTAQFGGGFSGTISTEARRTTQIIDANALPGPAGTAPLAAGGTIIPGSYPCAL
ncbi:MAG TPA: porin, partial [Xanthobacteraceae bacterium]|nr:porin [Xanthobacteraceae bacterium]